MQRSNCETQMILRGFPVELYGIAIRRFRNALLAVWT
jgi:hypothetical protein